MHTFECLFSVNGIRTRENIVANDQISARKLIEARYPGAKITWWSFPRRL